MRAACVTPVVNVLTLPVRLSLAGRVVRTLEVAATIALRPGF